MHHERKDCKNDRERISSIEAMPGLLRAKCALVIERPHDGNSVDRPRRGTLRGSASATFALGGGSPVAQEELQHACEPFPLDLTRKSTQDAGQDGTLILYIYIGYRYIIIYLIFIILLGVFGRDANLCEEYRVSSDALFCHISAMMPSDARSETSSFRVILLALLLCCGGGAGKRRQGSGAAAGLAWAALLKDGASFFH